jgi:hypothetical protein
MRAETPPFAAPATTISSASSEFSAGTSSRPATPAVSWTASGWSEGSRHRVVRDTASFPTAASAARLLVACSKTNCRTSALVQPARANSAACSGPSTTTPLIVSCTSAPVRASVPARSRPSCSGAAVCRASRWITDRVTRAVTVLSSAAKPKSAGSGDHGLSSSFSAMHAEYLAGVPWVAWSSTWGRRPNTLIAVSRIARPTVALARNPEPNTLPRLLNPSRLRAGPFTRSSGAVPVVLCQMPLVA